MNLPERINTIIETLGLNRAKFAKNLNVSSTTIDGYVKGRKIKGKNVFTQPNYDVIKKMIEVYNINPYYVFGLSNDMFDKKVDTKEINKVIKFIVENDEKICENVIFKEYLKAKAYEIKTEEIENKVKANLEQLRKEIFEKLKKD
ncbi:helix-turn-helix domain-containing protein [Pontimicrobium sp. MEBiC06410]